MSEYINFVCLPIVANKLLICSMSVNKLEENLKNILRLANINTELPEYTKILNWNHHSPSQITQPDDWFAFKYWHLTAKERAALKPNSKMEGGAVIGQSVAQIFANKIYDRDKKQFFQNKDKKTFTNKDAVEAYKKYKPISDNDKLEFDNNLDNIESILEQTKKGIQEIGLAGNVVAEKPVKHTFTGCKLPVSGQIDLCDDTKFIEVKTKWRKRTGKFKSDGTPSFSIVQPKPFDDYYLQTAFYHFATKLEPYLLIVNEDSYKIYTQENCYELQQENLKRIALKIRHTCLRRERLAERHAGKTTWTNDIPLDLSNFKWDDEYKNTAENIWNENLLTSTK
jgi:hypothetical protein